MRVYAPSEWGATIDYDNWNDPFTPDDGIALHHGGSSDYPAAQPPYTTTKEIAQLRSWERYHLSKGWRGIAYGWAVGQTGNLYRLRGWNRYGAHLGDIDGDGIANNVEIVPIIWIASGLLHTMSPEAEAAIEWLRTNVIEPASPAATWLYGHKEIQPKPTSCPGKGGMDYVTTHREVKDMPLTKEDLDKIADAVWYRFITNPVTGAQRGAQALLADAVQYSHQAANKTPPASAPKQGTWQED